MNNAYQLSIYFIRFFIGDNVELIEKSGGGQVSILQEDEQKCLFYVIRMDILVLVIETKVFECIVIHFFCPVVHTLVRMSYLRVDDLNRYFRKHISFNVRLIKFNQLKCTRNF